MERSYSEMRKLSEFEDRFEYLSLGGTVGDRTFGSKRHLNQSFYTSADWRRARNVVIARDMGCDLGVPGREIHGRIYIHHINPLRPEDFLNASPLLFDPENLITVTHETHNAIHYGDARQLPKLLVERRPGDTKLW